MIAKVISLFDPFVPRVSVSSLQCPPWAIFAGIGAVAVSVILNVLIVNAMLGATLQIKSLQTALVGLESELAENQAAMLESANRSATEAESPVSLMEIGSDVTYIFGNPRVVDASR